MRQARGRWWKRLLGVEQPAGDSPGDPHGFVGVDGGYPDRPRDPDFAVSLWGRLAARPGNLVLSPANIRLALGMVYAGAAGATAEEMARVLRLPPGDEVHGQMAAQLDAWGALPSSDGTLPSSPDRAVLRVVNRLWANRGHRFSDAFLARLCDSYGAPLGTLDFVRAPATSREAINRWVSEQTAHKIKELLPPLLIAPDTRLVLTSTIYSHARWARPFDRGYTRQAAFFIDTQHEVQAPFMSQIDAFSLARFRGGQLLELPYGTEHLVMDVILPDARDGLPQIEHELCDGALATWIGALARRVVMVSIPRFRVASELGLAGALRLLGMVGAFTWPGADFSRMDGTRELYLSEVLHQAEVEIDEQGTEAGEAAAAAVLAAGSTPRTRVPAFHADRPFLFVIRDPRTGAIVLLGRLTNPT
jgi:serine protease inhibitor